MMSIKLVLAILIATFPIFGFGQVGIDWEKCEKLKHEKVDFSQGDAKYWEQQIFKLVDCGFDTIDCKMAFPAIGNIMALRLSNHGDMTMEYSVLIALIHQIKNLPEYAQLRKEFIDGVKIEKKVPAFLNLQQYYDYNEGKKLQATLKKPLLIFFNSKNSIFCRKMEEQVLSDTSIMRLLESFIIVTLYVDEDEAGKKNAKLLESKYKSNAIPLFINEPVDEKWTLLSGVVSKEEFMKFLID